MITTPRQRTIARPASIRGTGLHTGREVEVTLRPAVANQGIVFQRVDLADAPPIPAVVEAVSRVAWETALGPRETGVGTVEHVLAAAAAFEIDNLLIEISGPELPALDGSAAGWCALLEEAKVVELDEAARVLAIASPVHVEANSSQYSVLPYDGYRVSVEIDFDHPSIGRQFVSSTIEPATFRDRVAPARTFGLERWRTDLEERGLAQGASHTNTIVLTEEGIATEADLRFPDEFARHKVIDLVGDLALIGSRLRAHVVAHRPGHQGNVELARRLRSRLDGSSSPTGEPALGIQEILEYIPHRYPFLLVDRILEYEPGRRIVGLKNVTINEPFFTGHFPDHPIMPGVLIVEAMAQVGGLLLMNEFENPRDKVVYFMSLDDVKFRKPVLPGDQLIFELELVHLRGRNCRMRGIGRVDGQPVAEATMMARVVDR